MVAAYIEHIGIYFFFVACAGVSIVVWVFNWICWYNQCCCCDFLHNPVNKRLVWWTSFIFLLGILACCISRFVTTNRFGFALEGAWCAFDRFYYDSLNGQLKNTDPKWVGLENIKKNLTELNECYKWAKEELKDDDFENALKEENGDQIIRNGQGYQYAGQQMDKKIFPLASKYLKIIEM